MSTTATQDREFIQAVVGSDLLESSIDWIRRNMSPDEVFSENDLKDWANGKECEYIFSKSELQAWAEDNGYIKE